MAEQLRDIEKTVGRSYLMMIASVEAGRAWSALFDPAYRGDLRVQQPGWDD